MKYFFIDSRIDEVLLNKFFQFANENSDDDWTISLWSTGGLTGMAKAILHIINSRGNDMVTTLICIEAYSACFDIFYLAKCKKVICRESKGMVHLSSSDLRVDRNGNVGDAEQKCIMDNWKEDRSAALYIKKILTLKEMQGFKKGEDIYLTVKRMKEIFPQAEIV